MNSHPILLLSTPIAECASRIAPTKSGDLADFVDATDLSIEFTEERKFGIRVTLDTHIIKLPIGALNYLWCATYLFVVLYNSYVENQGSGATALDTAGDPKTSGAIELFNWARSALVSGDNTWPDDAPLPSPSHQNGDAIHSANELFLAALAWIIHHERAHVEFKHQGNKSLRSVKEEVEADRSATKWVLHGLQNEAERTKRAFGIAVATLAFTLLDDPQASPPAVTTHPPDLNRLFDNIELAELSEESVVYSFCSVILQFCIAQYQPADAADGGAVSLADMFRDFVVIYHMRHRPS